MIKLSLKKSKVNACAVYQGKNDDYYNFILIPNKEGKDQYGNDGMVVESISKEERLAGKNGQIVGNYQDLDLRAPRQGSAPAQSTPPSGKFTPSAKPRF
jgi:hypothetical protein